MYSQDDVGQVMRLIRSKLKGYDLSKYPELLNARDSVENGMTT